jgi:hypothetical protein
MPGFRRLRRSAAWNDLLFFQVELCELQRRAVVEMTKEMELESVRDRLPTCLTKIDLGEVREIETLSALEA